MGAFGWGLLASSSLLIGAAVALVRPPGQRTVALVMAFGAGVLISAVAYDLVQDSFEKSNGRTLVAGLAAGALAFYVGDLIETVGAGKLTDELWRRRARAARLRKPRGDAG